MANYLDKVAVVEDLNGVSLTYFSADDMQKYGYGDEGEFMAWYMGRISPGSPYTVISSVDIPQTRTQRDEWSIDKVSKKVIIDPVKVAAKQAKEDEKNAILLKLKITKEELDKLVK